MSFFNLLCLVFNLVLIKLLFLNGEKWINLKLILGFLLIIFMSDDLVVVIWLLGYLYK